MYMEGLNYVPFFRNSYQRNEQIIVKQCVSSQRALEHAAWSVSKDLRAQIRTINHRHKM